MRVVFIPLLLIAGAWGEEVSTSNHVVGASDNHEDISDRELMLVFTVRQEFIDNHADTTLRMFRHGDRTPDQEEMDTYPENNKLNSSIFFPYGMKALTNKGKQRAYSVGTYIRNRYDGFVSAAYLTDEMVMRTTAYARTKMTALTALAGLYPPPPSQRWNLALNWQPVPYNTYDYEVDDLMYWYNCPRYQQLRNKAYNMPEVAEKIQSHSDLFDYLSGHTANNFTNPGQVFYLDNLLQTLNNVGVPPPKWALEVMPEIKDVTKLEYAIENYSPLLVKLASGVLLNEILNATSSFINGDTDQPKLRLYSAHENNVASLMAATRTFEPHQPNYGATYGLELWRDKINGNYSISVVYSKDAGGPGVVLPIKGCGSDLCDYDKFVSLVQEYAWSKSEFDSECKVDDC